MTVVVAYYLSHTYPATGRAYRTLRVQLDADSWDTLDRYYRSSVIGTSTDRRLLDVMLGHLLGRPPTTDELDLLVADAAGRLRWTPTEIRRTIQTGIQGTLTLDPPT